jgi:membrane protease YdiL (CAAX protease family)
MEKRKDIVWDRMPLFFLMCLFAWVIWGAQLAHKYGKIGWAPSMASPLNALTVWSPGLAAILLSALAARKKGVSELLRPLLAWRVPVAWFAFALFFEPLKWSVALAIDRLLGHGYTLGPVPLMKHFSAAAAYMIPVAVIFTLPNALGEELGWRGYALPRLQRKYGPLIATIALGLFWGIWHLPMWIVVAKTGPSALSLLVMGLGMVPAAILFTWIYNRTNGSLVVPVIFHASMAAKGYLFPSLPTITETLLLWVVAAAVMVFAGLGRNQSSTRGAS